MTHAGTAEKPIFRHGRPTAAVGIGLLLVVFLVTRMTSASALAPVNLGTAASFAVLAGTGVTNTPPTLITGNLGTCPTPSITGSPTVIGSTHTGTDPVCVQAQLDLKTAYEDAAGRPADTIFTGATTELGGLTLVEGTYKTATSFGITNALTLDANGNPDAVFIFQAGSTLGTGVGSSVVLVDGAQACNVFWQVGSSATLGSSSTFVGTIMALTTITANSGATVQGRLLARNGAVNLNNNVITRPTCAQTTTSTTTGATTSSTAGNTTSSTTGGGGTTTVLPTSTTPGGGGTTTTRPNTTTTTGVGATTTTRPNTTTSRVGAPVPSAGGQGTAPAAGGGSGGSATATTLNARTGTATLPRTGPSSASTQLTAALAAIVTGGVMVLLGSRRRRCVSDD